MKTKAMDPIYPGEVILHEYLEPLGRTQHRLSVAIGVPPRRINEIVHGTRRISADTAVRLPVSSARPSPSGSICRRDTTSKSNGTGFSTSSRRSRRWRARDGCVAAGIVLHNRA